MKHTFTLALSLNAVKQEISAQCAWIDATNLTILPPIVNPMEHIDAESVIIDEITSICNRLSGYILNSKHEGDIYAIEMKWGCSLGEKRSLLTKYIGKNLVSGVITKLYSTQKQASHIVELFNNIHDSEMKRILQLLAYTD